MTRRVALAVLFCLGAVVGASVVHAGDNAAVVEFDPRQTAVEPGETVALDVAVATDGAHGDAGLYRVALRLDYPAEYVSVADVEAGPWFQQADREVDVRRTERTNGDAGVTVLTQELSDPGSGVAGATRFATVTFEVAPDAPASTVVVNASETTAMLTSRYPQPVTARAAELRVDGGGDRVEPDVEEDVAFDAETTTATATEQSSETTAVAGGDSEGDVPAPDAAAVVAVLLAVLLASRQGARRR